MDREQVMALEGRELDAAVAEARGWTDIHGDVNCMTREDSYWGHPPQSYAHAHHAEVRFYHSDIAAAWELVEEMRLADDKLQLEFANRFIEQLVSTGLPATLGGASTFTMLLLEPHHIARAYLLAKMGED